MAAAAAVCFIVLSVDARSAAGRLPICAARPARTVLPGGALVPAGSAVADVAHRISACVGAARLTGTTHYAHPVRAAAALGNILTGYGNAHGAAAAAIGARRERACTLS